MHLLFAREKVCAPVTIGILDSSQVEMLSKSTVRGGVECIVLISGRMSSHGLFPAEGVKALYRLEAEYGPGAGGIVLVGYG